MDKTFTVKGTAGQLYTVNIEVRGVVGTRCYQGGTRPSTDSATIQDSGYNAWWYAGGTPYNATSLWNTYELHVSPSTVTLPKTSTISIAHPALSQRRRL